MPTLETTRNLAKAIHAYNDRSGIPYWQHVFAVAEIAVDIAKGAYTETAIKDIEIIALLHDSVEDTPIRLENLLNMGYSIKIVETIYLLTHKPEMSYDEYIQTIIKSNNTLAIVVKLADNRHNWGRPNGTKTARAKYIKAMKKLEDVLVLLKRL